jgi:Trk K+ transport system NAD-binding subunit
MTPKIIVYGLNAVGYRILQLLQQQRAQVIGVHDHPLPAPLEVDAKIIIGDLLDPKTFLAAGITTAHTLVIANEDDAINLDIVMQARQFNPRLRIINRLFNSRLGDRLDYILPEHTTMSMAAMATPIFTFAARGEKAIGQLQLFHQTWPISEVYIDEHHPWLSLGLTELWEDRSRMLIHYLTADQNISLVEAMNFNRALQIGDRLIIGTQPKIYRNQGSWLHNSRKLFNRLRQFQRHLRSGSISFLLLMVSIFIATLVYANLGWAKTSLVDALYFSVGMLTGAGGNESIVEKAAPAIKIFTVLMMVVGAGLVGICYALLTDWILGSRLRQVWNVARVPQEGHYIICGLGGLGVRIANHLINQGHEVVVIEQNPDNRFLSMVRSQRIPVILADAKLPMTLTTANIQRAAALLSVTPDDLTNLEIALTARELSPPIAIVMRSNNSAQAERMQQTFEFTAVLNPFEIAAPAFAAAALGGRVFGSGVTGGVLWIAVSLLITPAHPFCNRIVREVAIEADLVPLYLETPYQTVHGWELLQSPLNPNDVLHLTIPAKNIERLWAVTNLGAVL